jgi:hypothetical protein
MPLILRIGPLTGLLLLATLSVDIALLAIDSEGVESIYAILIIGQCIVLGGWLAVGSAHRLLKASLFLLAVTGIASLITLKFYEPPHYTADKAFPSALGASLCLACSAALIGLLSESILTAVERRCALDDDSPRFQFPVVELFGWTIVIALASIILRFTTLETAEQFRDETPAALLHCGAGACAMTLLLGRHRPLRVWNTAIAALLTTTAVIVVPSLSSTYVSDERWLILGPYVYVALWIAVWRLDDRILREVDRQPGKASRLRRIS